MNETRLSDEQDHAMPETRTPGEVAQVEQMRREAAEAAAAAPVAVKKTADNVTK